jgi:RNA polymerase sigma factor (sigma-70 family)
MLSLLVRKARKRDRAAFQKLMEEMALPMYKTAKAILKNDDDVADAMQETVLVCWEKIDTLKNDKFFKTWLTRILINNCYMICRQRSRMADGEEIPEIWSHEYGYANAEWEMFLNCLDEKSRLLIMLYYVQGYKTREIAEILNENENTIRGRLSVARKKLKKQYENENRHYSHLKIVGPEFCENK